MHESAIVDALLGEMGREVARSGVKGRVVGVTVVVGRLSGVDPEALKFAFEVLSKGTPTEGAELVVKEVKAVIHCGSCCAEEETDDLFAACPKCGSLEVSIDGPKDLLLESIEIEEPEDAGVP